MEGTVEMLVLVNEEGWGVRARVEKPSEYPQLDREALAAVEGWRFLPGSVAGMPTRMWHRFRVTFKIADDDPRIEAMTLSDPAGQGQ